MHLQSLAVARAPASVVMGGVVMLAVEVRAMTEVVTEVAVLAIARLTKTGVRAWVIPPSVLSAMRWSTLRWR